MATKVLVPRLGEGVEELTIVRWLKKEGEAINELEPLLEVETDKVVTEIPSPASGIVLKISVPENSPAPVGKIIAWIGQAGESIPESGDSLPGTPVENKIADHSKPRLPNSPRTGMRDVGFLSPVVRKIAAENNVDTSQVAGTGMKGRITKQDIVAYLDNRKNKPGPATSETRAQKIGAGDSLVGGTLVSISTVRRQIAERMQHSKQVSPHVLTVMEADMSQVVAHRAANKASFASEGVNLTFTAYFMQAVVAGLKTNPGVNSSWTEDGLVLHAAINIGMATSLGEEGLIVPVIKNADNLSLLGMARAVNELANRARSKKLNPDDVKGGTFTLTNHGIGGSLFAFPIINQPQCGILGVGALQKRVVVITDADGKDSIAIRPMIYLSFVFDHRILDGAGADAFLSKVKETLENWQ